MIDSDTRHSVPGGLHPAWRVGITMSLLFSAIGISLPYLPVWYETIRNLSGGQISLLLAGGMLVRIVTGPLLAAASESFSDRRIPLALTALAAGGLWLTFPLAPDFASLFALTITAQTLFSLGPPLLEAAAAQTTIGQTTIGQAVGGQTTIGQAVGGQKVLGGFPVRGPSYGLIRGMASLAFVTANVLGGLLVKRFGPEIILWLMAGLVFAAAIAALGLAPDPNPPERRSASFRSRMRAALALLRTPHFGAFLLATGLIQAAHAFLYTFSTLIWQRNGHAPDVIGALWATGVAAEILFLALSGWVIARVKPEIIILAGGCLAVLRWIGMGFDPPLAIAFLFQILHAGSFAMTHVGAVKFIAERLPARDGPMAQTMMGGLGGGLIIGILTLVSGPLYENAGARGYWIMAVVALTGTLIALRGLRGPAAGS